MKPEQRMWQVVKKHLPPGFERVENAAGVGMPDIYGCVRGISYWLELKVQSEETLPDDVSPLALLKPSQRVWHLKHAQQGGTVYILVRNGSRFALYDSRGTAAVFLFHVRTPRDWPKFTAFFGGNA